MEFIPELSSFSPSIVLSLFIIGILGAIAILVIFAMIFILFDEVIIPAIQRSRDIKAYNKQRNDPVYKSKQLLESHLTGPQNMLLHRNGFFLAKGSVSGFTYAISDRYKQPAQTRNITILDGLTELYSICTYVNEQVPVYDVLLIQKMLIESDEMEFWRRANMHFLIRAFNQNSSNDGEVKWHDALYPRRLA